MSLSLVNNKGSELQKSFERKIPFSNVSIQMIGFLEKEKEILETDLFGKSLFFKKRPNKEVVEGWFKLSDYRNAMIEIKRKITEEPEYIERIITKISNVWKELNELSENSEKYVKLSQKSKENFEWVAKYYYDLSHKSIPASWAFDIIGWALTELIEEKLKQKNKFSPEKIVILMSYGIGSIFIKEKAEFINLLMENFNEDAIKSHYKKWSFIGMDTPVGKPHELDFFKKKAEELKNKNLSEELKKIEENQKKELEEFNKHVNEIKDLKLLKRIGDARKFIEFKNNERILLHKYILGSLNIPINISQVLNLSYEDSQFITSHEVLDLIKKAISKEELLKKAKNRRKKGFILSIANNEVIIDANSESKAEVKTRTILKGLIASKGFVKGHVKIIENPIEDAYKLEKGDILVTSMTTPDFVPLMERSVAIITNEGGMLCHAAIVSRELGIPTIVGTENATEILKDGMFIEVRAHEEEGIIKIIGRGNEI